MSESWRTTALAACRLLGDAVSGRAFDERTLPDEAQLLGFAKVHGLVTLMSGALRTVGIGDTYHTLHGAAEKAAFTQVKNELLTAAVLEELRHCGIHVLPLKGAALQAVYPDGWIRTTTDTDWYVCAAQLDAAAAVLAKHGFRQDSAHDGDVCFQKPPSTVIELHTTLGGYTKGQRRALDRLSRVPFSVNEHYVYTLFHLYKHFLYAGAGVRLFLDMYCLSRAVTDRACVERWLEELGLLSFDRAVQTVCGALFDGEVCDDSVAEAVDVVLLSGTFGTSETYHAMKKAAQPLTRNNPVRVWLNDYGFDRHAMARRYPILTRHMWLYPFCVLHRLVRGVVFKRTVLRRAVEAEHAFDHRQFERVLKTMNIV